MFFLGVLERFPGDCSGFSGDLAAAISPKRAAAWSTLGNCRFFFFFSLPSLPSCTFASGVPIVLLTLIGTGIGTGVCLGGSCVDGRRLPGEADRLMTGRGWVAGGTAEAALGRKRLAPELDPKLRWGGRGTGVSFRPVDPSVACSSFLLSVFCFFAYFSALELLLDSLVAGVATGPFSPSCLRFFLELDLGVMTAAAS